MTATNAYSWHAKAHEITASIYCLDCGATRMIRLPEVHRYVGSRDEVATTTTHLLMAMGPPTVEHHLAALPFAARLAGIGASQRFGFSGGAPEALDVSPFVVRLYEASTAVVGYPTDRREQQVEACVTADDPNPLGSLAARWRGRPQEGEAAAVATMLLNRWGWRIVLPAET